MKKLLLLLLLVPLSFAAWQTTAALALVTSAALLAVLYMIGTGFDINELKIMVKEEFFQLIAAGLLVVVLLGTDGILNAISTNPAFMVGDAVSLQESASNSIDNALTNVTTLLNAISASDKSISIQGSKTAQCSTFGMGYSVSGCGGFSMLSTPLSMAGGITGFAIGELSAMKRLLAISETFALPFLLPLGIILRTFRLTRGAGGLLIALAISLHILLPMGFVFNEMLGTTFLADASSADYHPGPAASIGECTAGDTGEDNENAAVDAYRTLRTDIRRQLYTMLAIATLGPVLSLLLVAAGVRGLTAIAGAEIDVSAISRFI